MNKVLVGGVAVAVLLSVVAYFGQPDVNSVSERVSALETMVNGVKVLAEKLGAIPGTEVSENCFTVGGVRKCYYSSNFASPAATTTACSFNPGATSTLVRAAATITTATGTALQFEWGKATDSTSATTTNLSGVFSLDANTQGTLVASTTNSIGTVDVFRPNDYLNLKWGGAALGDKIRGRCVSEFLMIGQ